MIEAQGVWHDGRSSRSAPARLCVYTDGTVRLRVDGQERALSVADLTIPPRLGSTPRRVELPDGGTFESDDNDAFDAVLDQHGRRRHDWLHRMERRLGVVLLATVFLLAAGVLFATRGIPELARVAAYSLPESAGQWLSKGALEVLDQSLEPSELPEARREELRAVFARVAAFLPDPEPFELVFRGGGYVGANAFALPSGTVVLTDELVALAEHDAELEAVLAHEVGHVVHRHGLRQVIQGSLLALGLVLVIGDLSASSGAVAGLPAALAEARFSREFEREADDHALAYLELHGIDPKHFARILRRLGEDREDGGLFEGFLASHPATDERIARLEGHGSGGGEGAERP